MLSSTGISIFKYLKEPKNISDLAELLNLHHSTVSKAVSSLESEGFVLKEQNGNQVYIRARIRYMHNLV
ncbi:MarR family transcriptional regulator [Methanosarcina sp. DH2]|nr:MarR family transcriptional regulator [Methanosarcina sp. DH2]